MITQKQTIAYLTTDGKHFLTPEEAILHQKSLLFYEFEEKYNDIKRHDFD